MADKGGRAKHQLAVIVKGDRVRLLTQSVQESEVHSVAEVLYSVSV